jgi:predicted nucleic acid-binding Zn ribbon protein
MFESDEQKKRAELIIMLLAKLYVVLELSVDACPVCHKALSHDSECPISLAWSLLTQEEQRDAHTAIRALALSLGTEEESLADPMVH